MCTSVAGVASCSCNAGLQDVAGVCVRAQSCNPNPCTGAHKSVCTATNGLVACACDDGFRDDGAGGCVADDPCANDPCTEANRGVCVAQGSTAICRCDSGFLENAQGVCVAAQSCTPNPCAMPGKSVCAVNDNVVTCACDVGLVDDGMGGCTAINPCANNPCTQPNRGVCVAQGSTAICQCDSGFIDDGTGACVRAPSCMPNPCTQPNRTQCSTVGGLVTCGCDSGYRPDVGGQCVPMQACNPNPCTQPNRGVCTEQSGVAICGCNAGYRDQSGACVLDDACDPNPCTQPNRGVCTAANGTAICGCNAGFQDQGGTCVVVDVCSPNPCNQPNRGVCTALNGAAVCGCNAGFVDMNGSCVQLDACNPNPCNQPNRGVCSAVDGGASCACNIGYQEGPTGCEVIAPPTCSTQHSTGDSYEPDECPALAKPIFPGTPQQHTYAPAGDVDWVLFNADAGTVVLGEVSGVSSYVSLYGSNGATAIATNGSNRVHVKLASTGTFFMQARPQTASAMGNTTLSLTFSSDDHADSRDGNPSVVMPANPGTSVNGVFNFPGDVDCLAVPVQANRVYQLEELTTLDVRLTVFTATGTYIPRTDSEWLRFKTAVAETLFLCVEANASSSLSAWTLRLSDSGVDDHADSRSDNPATLTPSASPGNTLTGKFDFVGDVDCLAVPVQAGRIYHFAETSGTDVVDTLYTATGTFVASTEDESHRFLSQNDETLYFCTRASSATNIASWTLTVTDVGVDDHANSRTENPATLLPGATVTGQFQYPYDTECLAVPVQANRIYVFSETSNADVYTAIYTATGTFVSQTDTESHRFIAGSTQTLYLCTRAFNAASLASWTLRVTDEGVDDYVNSRADGPVTLTPTASPGASLSGNFQYPYDVECVAVPVQANRIYTFAETTNVDVFLSVYTATGTYLAETDAESVRFEAGSSQTLFLCTRSFNANVVSGWTLRVTDEGVDDHADSRDDTPAPLSPGASLSGRFDLTNDTDCVAVPVIANHGYTFEETTSTDVYLTVYTATATLISTTDSEAVHFKASASQTLFLCTRAYASTLSAWTLRVIDNGEDDHADARTGATGLTVAGSTSNGALQYTGDFDYFTFTTAGPLALRVVTTGVATSVRVETATGTAIATGTGPGSLTFSVTAAGTYFVRVSTGALGAYTVGVAN